MYPKPCLIYVICYMITHQPGTGQELSLAPEGAVRVRPRGLALVLLCVSVITHFESCVARRHHRQAQLLGHLHDVQGWGCCS